MTYTEIKNKIATDKDYMFLSTNEHLGKNVCLLGLGGSYAYGTNIETSDIDVRGIALNTAEEILLGRDFETVVNTVTDTTIYSFNKIVKLLISCNPNTIELLGLKPEQYIYKNEVGQLLLDNKHLFLSKKVVNSFGGYAHSQLRRLDNKSARVLNQTEHEKHILNSINNATYSFAGRYPTIIPPEKIDLFVGKSNKEGIDSEILANIHLENYPVRDYADIMSEINAVIRAYDKNSSRNRKAIEHNKLSKHMMHLLRLYMMCIDILEEHEINTYREKEHDLLMSIRNNDYLDLETMQPTEDFNKLVDEYQRKMEEAVERTTLPNEPDYEKINELVKKVNRDIILNDKEA